MMTEKGLTANRAASIAGVMGLAGLAGRLVTGYLIDRLPGRMVAAGAYCIPIVACVLLLAPAADTFHAVAAAFAIGLALGSEMDVMAHLATRYFGLRHYGLLFGILTGVVSAGAGVGPVVAGMIHDRYNSYDRLGPLLIAGFATSAILALTLGRYPDRSAFDRSV
jgi:MFS family permease